MKSPPMSSGLWVHTGRANLELFLNPLEFLQQQGWHEVGGTERWDIEKMLRERQEHLVHSNMQIPAFVDKNAKPAWQRMFFRPSERLLISLYPNYGENAYLGVWATDPETARAEFEKWRESYRMPPKRRVRPAEFDILTVIAQEISTHRVQVLKRFLTKREDLGLHYGSDFPEWSELFMQCLKKCRFGASVLRGDPGTGKTSYLRFLIHKLRKTHRFYYLPTEHARLLSDPQMVEFWSLQNLVHNTKRKVMILEDAEALLMERAGDNRSMIANMLNIADGLLGEFLQVHLIFTINAPVEKLDPAVTRNGRMIAYRHFRRLDRNEAEALAEARGFTLVPQDDYSLAEIYNKSSAAVESTAPENRVIGFAQNSDHINPKEIKPCLN